MHCKSSWEAVNRAGPFVSEFELAQQTGIAYPGIWVAESMGALRGKVPIWIYMSDSWIES